VKPSLFEPIFAAFLHRTLTTLALFMSMALWVVILGACVAG
jgi:hypothetical protein